MRGISFVIAAIVAQAYAEEANDAAANDYIVRTGTGPYYGPAPAYGYAYQQPIYPYAAAAQPYGYAEPLGYQQPLYVVPQGQPQQPVVRSDSPIVHHSDAGAVLTKETTKDGQKYVEVPEELYKEILAKERHEVKKAERTLLH